VQADADAFLAAVQSVASDFGRTVTPEQARGLARYFELLLLWNRRINLTGARTLEALVSEHLPDSFALDRLVPNGHTLLDVGSGGGLPAVPFRILRPDPVLTLLEPRSRRAAFLRTALRELGLQGRVETRRLEQVTTTFDTLSARAVLPPDPWLTAATPRLNPGGRIIVFLADRTAWSPPPSFSTLDQVPYTAAARPRLALAVQPNTPATTP
jgi:16S rRNA (guanine527-N7)-methyltransferase